MVQNRFHQRVATACACAALFWLLSLAGCQSRNSGPAPPNPKEEAPKEDPEAIQGTWVVVSAEENGVPVSGAKGERHTFTAEGLTCVSEKGEEMTKATYKLDPAKSPKEITMCIRVGPLDTFARGIYQLDKDALKICWGTVSAEGPVPKEFKTAVGSKSKLVVYKREKP